MDPDSGPDHSQNGIISSFYHFQHILKISKSVLKLCGSLDPDDKDDPDSDPDHSKNHLFLVPFRPSAENVITIHT